MMNYIVIIIIKNKLYSILKFILNNIYTNNNIL